MKPKSLSVITLKSIRSCPACVLTLASAIALTSTSQANVWIGTTGSWGDSANWDGGVPGLGVYAGINNGGTATITGSDNFGVGDLVYGENGTGTITQDGGSLTSNAWVVVGKNNGSNGTGTYNLSGGSFSQSGTNQNVIIGENTGGTGILNLSDTGTFGTTREFWVGQAGGNGTVNQSGGTLNLGNWAAVGRSGGTGNYNLSGGTINKTGGGDFLIGDGGGATNGTMTQTGGAIVSNNWTSVGKGGTGTYDLSGGSLTQDGRLLIGRDGGGNGTMNQTGGTASVTGFFAVGFNGASGTLNHSGGTITAPDKLIAGLRDGAAGTGVINVSNTATVNAGEIWVGQGGGSNGTMNISGGTVNASNWVAIGRDGATGTLNVSGGTFEKTGDGNISISSGGGAAGTGTMNISGGTVNSSSGVIISEIGGANGTLNMSGSGVANFPLLEVGRAGTGTANLNGGTLAVTQINGTGTLNFNGGTLKANTGANAAFLGGLTRANVHNGGAVIDTNSQDVTIAQNLLHSNLGGANATDGGLTKNSAGNLTLSGANDYNGGTTVNGGTLTAGSTSAFGSGNVTVNTGATLDFAGNAVSNTVTNNGGTLLNAVNLAVNQTGGSVSGSISGGTLNGSIAGNFSASGTVAGTSTITGKLGGTATFTGAVTFANGSTHGPGNSPGIETFASGVTYLTGSTLEIELVGDTLAIRGTDYDGVDVTGGDLTIQAGAILSVIDLGDLIDYTSTEWDGLRNFTIVDSSGGGTTSGDFTLDTSLAGAFGAQGSWSLLTTSGLNGDTVLTWTPVPEPSTYAALAGLAALGLALRRRRQLSAGILSASSSK